MTACWNAQAGETDDHDTALAQGKEALDELGDLGWEPQVPWKHPLFAGFDSSWRLEGC